MQVVNKFMMLQIAVSDMPKAKEFYAEKLGMEVTADYRRDDDNWWVSLTPGDGVTLTLTTHRGHMTPGSVVLYFATADIEAAHSALEEKGVKVSNIRSNLHGPGSGGKWFNFTDVDGNLVHIEQV